MILAKFFFNQQEYLRFPQETFKELYPLSLCRNDFFPFLSFPAFRRKSRAMSRVHISFGMSVPEALSLPSSPEPHKHPPFPSAVLPRPPCRVSPPFPALPTVRPAACPVRSVCVEGLRLAARPRALLVRCEASSQGRKKTVCCALFFGDGRTYWA